MDLYFVDINPYNSDECLVHEGTPQPYNNAPIGSGRYRKGTGENPYQHSSDFLDIVKKYRKEGMSETQIAYAFGMTTTEYRARKSIENQELYSSRVRTAVKLKDKQMSNVAIAKAMGTTENNVRNWLKQGTQDRLDTNMKIANVLMQAVEEKGYIDVGEGVEYGITGEYLGGINKQFGVSRTSLNNAIQIAKDKGYSEVKIYVPQPNNPNNKTTVKILAPPGTTSKDIWDAGLDKVQSLRSYSQDNGKTFYNIEYPTSIDSKRIFIRYGDDNSKGASGSDLDGVIQIRPGVEDLSLGNSSYAQVRIAVDGTHFLKGMALYSNDIPAGYDIVYNTNKKTGTPKEKVFKELKTDKDGNVDKDNPFGALLKQGTGQRHYIDPETGEDKLSPINKLREEGDWDAYSKTLASQMLSKQPEGLIKRQLNISYDDKLASYNEIKELTNPVVKKKLLEEFASDCDSSAVYLKAAALPRQTTKVILPIPEMKDNEIYAPTYKNGENVALIRYPHGGTFEIPMLKVNNKQPVAKDILGNAIDAVGINSKVAEKLSGADFDGDTVIVIPANNPGSNIKITSTPSLTSLKNFDTKQYKYSEDIIDRIESLEKQGVKPTEIRKITGVPYLDEASKGNEMGRVSNLITDMTLKGATPNELARAVKHSMVVIDAAKHKLDYKASEKENNIAELRRLYQAKDNGKFGGASTLISKAKGDLRVPERKKGVYITDPETGKTKLHYIDPETGKELYRETGRNYISKTGKEVQALTKITNMEGTDDAFTLSSGTRQETLYAEYANKLKALANEARLESLQVPKMKYNPEAAKVYSDEVLSLNSKLNNALRNKPKERQAQMIANEILKMKKSDNPDMTPEETKKAGTQALQYARGKVGASKPYVEINAKEWEAIQAGAISSSKLADILSNSKPELIKTLATPRQTQAVSTGNQARIKGMAANGYTISEIAQSLHISPSTVAKYIK